MASTAATAASSGAALVVASGVRSLSFCALALSRLLYICEAAAEATPPMATPMIEPASPILDDRANDVAAARPLAMTVETEKSPKRPFSSVPF